MLAFFYNISIVIAVWSGFIVLNFLFFGASYTPDRQESISFWILIISLVFIYTFH
jgi:hypothetical protein